jgi:glycerol-3-phosphate dehydrogenase
MRDEEFDVVVIGGGVTGCGIALDAATRGLSVALVEQRDLASGTSSRSSKLIHGGLRYLEKLDFKLVREALIERQQLLGALAPHLVKPVPFLMPLTKGAFERAYIGSGVLLYDSIGGAGAVPRHRHYRKRRARQLVPSLREDVLTGAIRYFDAQVDDARHTMMVARTAARYGAQIATGVRVTGLLRSNQRVTGVQVHDLEDDSQFDLRGRYTINASGVWADDIAELAGARPAFNVRASKGIHITVPRERISSSVGLIMRTEKSVLFVIPWKHLWLIGTTDTDWDLDRAHPAATRADVDYLLERVNGTLTANITHDDVVGFFAGLRPLVAGAAESTAALSREHGLDEPLPGLQVIAGGKYTTYRPMAAHAVDVATKALGVARNSITDQVPLLGAEGYHGMWNAREQIASRHGLSVAAVEHLLDRYGSLADDLLTLVSERPELAEPLPGAEHYLTVEAVYAVTHEGALHVEDVLARRTRVDFEVRDGGAAAAEPVARRMAEVLGWDDATVTKEVEQFQARLAARNEAIEQPDDHSANARRLAAPDSRVGAS